MKRHLCAVFAADIVGYSRLMEADETGTIERLQSHMSETVRPAIAGREGRVVKLMGDGILAEFDSVVDAVSCAVNIQRAMEQREAYLPEDRRILYRIGINLGDVILEGDDMFGDGVNIAARLEQAADPGGICISGTAFDHLKSQIDVGYEDMGLLKVHNIEQPVRAYRVLLRPTAASSSRWRRPVLRGALAACLAAALGVAGWLTWTRGMSGAPVSPAVLAPIPTDQPAIAVLPFDNMSGDPGEDYFSDGMTEDLITDLSQVSGLRVLARNTTFTYRNRAVNVAQVGRELGVSYVLEGSVRRAGARVRINAQLIDVASGAHVWANRYDRDLTDVFALQDDVVQRIVAALAVTLDSDEQKRLSQAKKIDPKAYDAFLRGLEQLRRFTAPTNQAAREFFEQAVAVDPRFARAVADLALTYALDAEQLWTEDPESAAFRALEIAKRAQELDPNNAQVHFVLSVVYRGLGDPAASLASAHRAVELDPNYADGYSTLAISLSFSGFAQDAQAANRRAAQLNPLKPFFYVWSEGLAAYALGDFEAARELFEQVAASNPQFPAAHKMLAVTYVELGRLDDAEWAGIELQAAAPNFRLGLEERLGTFADPARNAHYIEMLRMAGLD